MATLQTLTADARHVFIEGNIGNYEFMLSLLKKYSVRAIFNFVAESHVDRSIHDPSDYIQTNVVGTFNLLEAVYAYWLDLPMAFNAV